MLVTIGANQSLYYSLASRLYVPVKNISPIILGSLVMKAIEQLYSYYFSM